MFHEHLDVIRASSQAQQMPLSREKRKTERRIDRGDLTVPVQIGIGTSKADDKKAAAKARKKAASERYKKAAAESKSPNDFKVPAVCSGLIAPVGSLDFFNSAPNPVTVEDDSDSDEEVNPNPNPLPLPFTFTLTLYPFANHRR